jgi:hypothetical protein
MDYRLFDDSDPDAGTYQRTEDEAVRDEFRLIFESEREDEIQDNNEPTAEDLDEMSRTFDEGGPEFDL